MKFSVLLTICFIALLAIVKASDHGKIWGITIRGGYQEDCDENGNPFYPTKSKPQPPTPIQTTSTKALPPPPPVQTTSSKSLPPPPMQSSPSSTPSVTPTTNSVNTPTSTPPPVSTSATTSTTSSKPAECTSGMITNSKGHCVMPSTSTTPVVCATGTINSQGNCEVASTTSTKASCTAGMTSNSNGDCVPPPTSTCSGGMTTDSSGICVPVPTPTTSTSGSCSGEVTSHTVAAGETCSSIASGTQSSVDVLSGLNPGIKCESLTPGQKINVCGGSATPITKTSSTACTETACGGITYATSNTYTGVVPTQQFSSAFATTTKPVTSTIPMQITTSAKPYVYENGATASKVSMIVVGLSMSALMLL